MGTWSDWKKLGGDPNLQYTTNYIQVKDVDGNWHNLKYVPSVPIPNGLIYQNGTFFVEFDNTARQISKAGWKPQSGFTLNSDSMSCSTPSLNYNRCTSTNEKYEIGGFSKLYVEGTFGGTYEKLEVDISQVTEGTAYIYLCTFHNASYANYRYIGISTQKDYVLDNTLANLLTISGDSTWKITKIWLE